MLLHLFHWGQIDVKCSCWLRICLYGMSLYTYIYTQYIKILGMRLREWEAWFLYEIRRWRYKIPHDVNARSDFYRLHRSLHHHHHHPHHCTACGRVYNVLIAEYKRRSKTTTKNGNTRDLPKKAQIKTWKSKSMLRLYVIYTQMNLYECERLPLPWNKRTELWHELGNLCVSWSNKKCQLRHVYVDHSFKS